MHLDMILVSYTAKSIKYLTSSNNAKSCSFGVYLMSAIKSILNIEPQRFLKVENVYIVAKT